MVPKGGQESCNCESMLHTLGLTTLGSHVLGADNSSSGYKTIQMSWDVVSVAPCILSSWCIILRLSSWTRQLADLSNEEMDKIGIL